MKVIIPAAGIGSRLKPHTYTIPKVLIPVAGKPIIEHIIDQVVAWGATQITVIVGHLGGLIEEGLSRRPGIEIEFRRQESLLGLGHAILTGLDPDDREVIVILGDCVIGMDMKPVIHRGKTSIGVKEVSDPRKLGVVIVEDGLVKRMIEKPSDPPSNLAIVGVYYLRDAQAVGRAVKETIERGITVKGEYQVTDALQLLIEAGEQVEYFKVDDWYDCGKPETILDTNRYLLAKHGSTRGGEEPKDSVIIDPVYLGGGSKIERSLVGPFVSVGENTVVSDSVVKDSIIGDNALIKRAVLEETLIGNRVELHGRLHKLNIGASSRLVL